MIAAWPAIRYYSGKGNAPLARSYSPIGESVIDTYYLTSRTAPGEAHFSPQEFVNQIKASTIPARVAAVFTLQQVRAKANQFQKPMSANLRCYRSKRVP